MNDTKEVTEDMVNIEEKSMFGRISKHEDKLEEHDDKLEEHSLQLKVQAEHIKQLQDNSLRLENVVMSENRDTRATIINTNQKLHELITGLMGYNTGQTQIQTTLKMAKLESLAKIIGILSGSGGLLYVLFTKL